MDSKFLFIIPKDNFFEWEAAIVGPEGSPFEDGVFIARLVFPQDYPLNPPSMRFVSTIFHPSISIHMLRLTAVEMYFQLLFTVQSMFLSQLEGKSTIEWSFPLQKVPVFGTTLLTNRFWLILRKCWLLDLNKNSQSIPTRPNKIEKQYWSHLIGKLVSESVNKAIIN